MYTLFNPLNEGDSEIIDIISTVIQNRYPD